MRLFKAPLMSLFSSLNTRVTRALSPGDWLIIGFFIALMMLGAGTMLAQTSYELSAPVPQRGGTHIEGILGTPRFVNPLLAISDADRDLSSLIFSGLMKITKEGSLELDLAESYTISEDLRTYTFTLKNGIVFHDGTPITADDVVFTVRMAKHPDVKSAKRANWEGVDAVVIDDRTISFTLPAPFPLFLENTTLGIMPEHLWEEVAIEEFPFTELNTRPIGSGPYKVHEVKKTASGVPVEYRLRAFDGAGRHAYIKNFVVRFYQSSADLERAFELRDIDGAHSIVNVNGTAHEAILGRVFGVFFNQSRQELFTDTVVRRALEEALDKQAIVDTILSGYGVPLEGPLPPLTANDYEYERQDEEARIENARAILEANGWERGEDGVFEKTSGKETKRLSFSLDAPAAPELRSTAEYVSDVWRRMGAEVSLSVYETTDLNIDIIRPRDYEALLFGLVVGRELDLFAFWHSSQRNDPGLNIALYANIATDRYLEEARGEIDPSMRREAAELAAAEITADRAAIFLYAPTFVYYTNNNVAGINLESVSSPSDRLTAVDEWFLETERVWSFFSDRD